MTQNDLEKQGDKYAPPDWKWWEKASIAKRVNNSKQAKYYYEQAIANDPLNANLWAKLASQSVDEATLEYINKAVKLEPENPEFLMHKAKILAFDFDGRLDEALKFVSQALELTPNNIQALLLISDIYKEKASESSNLLEQSTEVSYLLQTAADFLQADMQHEALKCIDQALTLKPDDRHIWTTKYWYLQHCHRYYDAETIPADKLLFTHSASIEEFCRTGEYGPLKLGMSREQVRQVLGDPENVGGLYPKQIKPVHEGHLTLISDTAYPIWGYGCVELFFGEKRDLLHRISCKNLAYWMHSWSQIIHLDPWIYRGPFNQSGVTGPSITKDEFEAGLQWAGIDYQDLGRKPIASFWLGYIQLASGVEAIYEEDDDGTIIIGLLHHKDNQFSDYEFDKQ